MIKHTSLLLLAGLAVAGCSRTTSTTPSSPARSQRQTNQALVNSITGNAQGARDQARALKSQADQRLAARDYAGAMDKRLQMMSVRGNDTSTFGALTSYAIQQLALGDLRVVASHLDAPSCRKYAAQLKALDAQMPSYVAMLQSQKADEIKQFEHYSTDPKKWGRLIAGLGRTPQEQQTLNTTPIPQIKANIEAAYDALINKANQPFSWAPVMVSVDPYTRTYAMPYQPSMARFQWTRHKLDRLFAVAALQARADRLEKKTRSEPLPLDPFGTGPLKQKNGTIYSVGPDGKDDGGKPLPKPLSPRPSDTGDILAPTL